MTYSLIDAGDFMKLEQIGPYRIARPSPQAVWKKQLKNEIWKKVDAHYIRKSGGDGYWEIHSAELQKKRNDGWWISVDSQKFLVKLTEFGHIGIFPEQHKNWNQLKQLVREKSQLLGKTDKNKKVRVLNLFAYTGGSTIACAMEGAEVVHVDASKTSVAWARENAEKNLGSDAAVRWMVDDVKKFVAREIRRNARYDGIILDPPSFGRGNKAQVWKIESDLVPLCEMLAQILAPSPLFILLSAHSNGYTPSALENILLQSFSKSFAKGNKLRNEEMLVSCGENGLSLPSGASALLFAKTIE